MGVVFSCAGARGMDLTTEDTEFTEDKIGAGIRFANGGEFREGGLFLSKS